MNNIWNIVEPYIISAVKALLEGTALVLIIRLLIKQFLTKASSVYDINAIANKVADKLGGKTINIDMAPLVDKRITESNGNIERAVKQNTDEINSIKRMLASIGVALSHLKMLTDDERAALIANSQELGNTYVPPAKEVIATVKLEPIPVASQPTSANSQERSQTVNME